LIFSGGLKMTPDEYRKKHKSCYTCEYYEKDNPFELKCERCKVKNREIKDDDKKCSG
jgi:Zn finger protein HypA/HybF involved in hydrogenase expression